MKRSQRDMLQLLHWMRGGPQPKVVDTITEKSNPQKKILANFIQRELLSGRMKAYDRKTP